MNAQRRLLLAAIMIFLPAFGRAEEDGAERTIGSTQARKENGH
ncbi:hypothetical protein BACCAP_01452 [Pseudoflavonifractor capillosus ATCC 29799]|uniref:Uncharacterized protein n=1 Tax=Pseudoflavonifractor capillosus ATCC 29799 TaxID=411467 RepID=A6NTC3_9FIRM|nr:hypothetical protein BACCAP_01452 [Pseudoflavonifractor capillosus ATCC 29799]